MVSSLTWSGSRDNIARTLQISWVYPIFDYYTPKIYPKIGDEMRLYDNKNEELFRGKVFYNERLHEQGTIQITCYDDAIRLSKSKGTFNFKDKPAEAIAKTACNEIGISVGKLAITAINQKMLCQNKGLYEIIKEAYENATLQNKKEYYIGMQKGQLNIIEFGSETLDYVLDSETNITSSTYSENAENVINRVKIYDEDDKYLDVVNDDKLIKVLGVFQDTYTKEEDKQAKTVATNMLTGIEKSIDVTVLGNVTCLSGKAIKVKDSIAKIEGTFWIESDSHDWSNNQYTTTLTLKYKE